MFSDNLWKAFKKNWRGRTILMQATEGTEAFSAGLVWFRERTVRRNQCGGNSLVRSGDNMRAKGNLKGKRGVKWACEEKSKIKSSQEHSLTMAEMRLLKSEVGKMEYKEQRNSLSAKQWADLSILRQEQDGGQVAKNSPAFSPARGIVLTYAAPSGSSRNPDTWGFSN